MSTQLEIVDTFPAFLAFFPEVVSRSLPDQIEAWETTYMSQWPELLQKQKVCYAEEGEDWQAVAQRRIFPRLAERLPVLATVHENLLPVLHPTFARARAALGFEKEVIFVLYVGIGCGAGWATTYQDTPAVLFGLENAAEEGWTAQETLRGLVAHELGHLAHVHWRAEAGLEKGRGPWWQLYNEGFAQRCEHLIHGRPTWHMTAGYDEKGGWYFWCRSNESWLAQEFLRRVEAGESLRPFFGSWHDLQGHKQCGYYLGHEVLRQLEKEQDLHTLALLDNVEGTMREVLERMSH